MNYIKDMFDKIVTKLTDHPLTVSAFTGGSSVITYNDVVGKYESHILAFLSILIAAITLYGKIKNKIASNKAKKGKR